MPDAIEHGRGLMIRIEGHRAQAEPETVMFTVMSGSAFGSERQLGRHTCGYVHPDPQQGIAKPDNVIKDT